MAKQLNVALNIDAQTGKAKQAFIELNKYLSKIVETKQITVNDTSINNAKKAAIDLKKHLDAATNVNTGKLDLSKFSSSLAKSGQSLKSLHADLSKIGPDGQSAFLALSKSIAAADASALTLGNKLGGLLTTLKNTARWQLSSSLLHGFMGTVQSAYGYAQDLNKSLNNIRIVTGQSVDQMARFADEANRAAKALSTSTTAYTDAALIYYQQGLGDQAVKERTETTLKLSNVSRQSAEEVSSQMTAIWNNFDDGSKKLEYYADVITALGAATAASSAEISDGIQKFAAVADTVGLSYEKATAALATVVAETRQSADVVGTAFKTMFARFQGLELGETLEDGVTLNKYSEAIATVGVNILEANGDLKDMDTILDELGAKWNTIGQAQKVALAETVAGTRQYAQFMAIMDNYDKILANQGIAEGSEGALQKQADIYAESWEAARKRVRAVLEEIYTQLLNDKFFITLLNGAEKTLNIISNVIDGLGGIKGMLLLIGSIVLNKYAKEMPAFFEKVIQNISILTGKAEQNRQSMLSQNLQIVNSMKGNSSSQEVSAQIDTMSKISEMTLKLAQNRDKLSQAEIANYENKIKEVQIYGDVAAAIGKTVDELNKEQQAQRNIIRDGMQGASAYGNLGALINADNVQPAVEKLLSGNNEYNKLSEAKSKVQNWINSAGPNSNTLPQLNQQLKDIDTQLNAIKGKITGKDLLQGLEQTAKKLGQTQAILTEIENKTTIWGNNIKQFGKDDVGIKDLVNDMQDYIDKAKQAGIDTAELEGALADFADPAVEMSIEEVIKAFQDFAQNYDTSPLTQDLEQFQQAIVALGGNSTALEVYIQKLKEGASAEQALAAAKQFANQQTKDSEIRTLHLSEAMGRLAGTASQVVMAINAFKNIGKIIDDDDLTNGEKFLQVVTSLSMALPVLTTLLNLEKMANLSAAAARIFGIKAITAENAAHLLSIPIKTAAGAAGWIALGPLLAFVAIAGGAIALIIHLAKVIETPTEKLKRLKKEQEELNEAVSEAKQKWEDFNNTISSYDEALKGLSKLTEGTTEFNEKLTETNELAKQLIKTLSLKILEDYFINDQGAIVYTAAGRAKINDAQKQGQQAQAALDWASLQKENQVEEAEYYDKLRKRREEEVGQIREAAWTDYLNSSRNNKLSYNEYTKLGAQARGVLGQYRDSNGNVQSGAYSNADVINEIKEWAEDQRVTVDEETIKYILGSIRAENQAGANFVFNYDDEILHVAQQLDPTKKLSSAVAKSIFNNAEAIQQAQYDKEQEVNGLSDNEVTDRLKKLFAYLDDDTLQKLINTTEGGAKGLLASTLVEQKVVADAQKALSNVTSIADKNFSEKNKDTLINIINGQLEKISPEDIKDLKLTDAEKTAFGEILAQLSGAAIDDIKVDEIIQKNKDNLYDPVKYYQNQIKGLSAIQQEIADLNKAYGSLKLGDIIDLEAYQGLTEEMQSYFTMMEDGTYKLVGSAEQFQAALFREKSAKFENDLGYYNQIMQMNGYGRIDLPTDINQTDFESFSNITNLNSGHFLMPEEQAAARQETIISYAMLSDNLQQLSIIKERLNELGATEAEITLAENVALQELATKYDTCNDELQEFQFALSTNNEELIAAASKTLEYSIKTAELAEKMGLAVDDIEDQTRAFVAEEKSLDKYIKSEEDQIKVATKMAILNQSMNKGVATLSKNWKDWKAILDTGNKTSMDYIDTIQEMRKVLKDLAGIVDDNFIPDDFFEIEGVMDLMDQAAQGDAKSINLLGTALAKAAVGGKEFSEGMQVGYKGIDPSQITPDNAFDSALQRFDYYKNNVLDGIETLTQKIADGTAEAGMSLTDLLGQDAETWTSSLNELAMATNMTVDEMTSTLNALGIEAEVTSEWKKTKHYVPKYRTYQEEGDDENGHYIETKTVEQPPEEVDGWIEVAQINMGKDNKGKLPEIKYAGRSTPPPSTQTTDKGGSGGSKKKSSKEHKQPTEESERYHVLNEQLDDLTSAYDKAAKAKDRLYGKNKLQAMKDESAALQKLIAHNQKYLAAIEAYRKSDKEKLLNGGLTKEWVDSAGNLQRFISSGLGIDLSFDEDGNVLDYDRYIDAAVDAYNRAVDAYNQAMKAENISEEAANQVEDTFKLAEMQYELVMQALTQYEETNNKFQEQLEIIQDQAREAQDKRLEEWSYKLDLRIKVNDEDKRYLEYFRKRLQSFAKDTFAPVVELLSYWNKDNADSDWKLLQIGANTLKSATEDLLNASHGDPIIDPKTGEILQDFEYGQEEWMGKLDECQDKIYSQIDALYELDDTMTHYYAETLSEAEAQLDKYMTKMEDCTSVLKHFKSISDLLGKETNYEWIGTILAGQRQTVQNELESSSKEYELARAQYERMLNDYQSSLDKVDEGTRKRMEDELQAQYESMSKWHEKMLSKTEEYAELLNEIYENTLKKIGKAFEDVATSGQGWESMMNSMDRVAAYQDLILTRTNQVYETNKLMNMLSQDIDKTTNATHKTKLKNFQQEIQDMQDMNIMSKFDLEVAKARYEVLKEQIALEEAQNAKSTVRLQRDNEGNYGYVYTADQDAVDNAKQALADKQNDLYNLTLQKANENAKALAQLDQEMYAEIERISLLYLDDKVKMEEETNRIIEEYAQRRSILVRDYAEADYWQQQVSITKTNEAYGDYYKQNIADTDTWRAGVAEMVSGIDGIYTDWTNDMDTYVRPVVGSDLEELKEKTEELTKASEEYSDWFDDFADQTDNNLQAIQAITHEYFMQRQEVEALISELMEYADAINNIRAQEAGVERGLTGNVGYDPSIDYSKRMLEYYGKNQGEYNAAKAAREAKIRDLGLEGGMYTTGSKFDAMVSTYVEQGLSGNSIYEAILEWLEKQGIKFEDWISQFDTGGYTGNGDGTGKLAILHSKELVLNPVDTENLLRTISIVRELSSGIDLRAAASNFSSSLSSPFYEGLSSVIQQDVTIHAEFPNATNHNEIEEAFNTLINRAAQFANRT